jgi:plasmid stability protein
MGRLRIRKSEDKSVARVMRRIARRGTSAEEEVRQILRDALSGKADVDFKTLAAKVRKLTAGRQHDPSEVLIREGRDER